MNYATAVTADPLSLAFVVLPVSSSDKLEVSVAQGRLHKLEAFTSKASPPSGPGDKSLSLTPVKVFDRWHVLAVYQPPAADAVLQPMVDSITAVKSEGGESVASREVPLKYPPLLLVHGIWSDGSAWQGLKDHLQSRYPAAGIHLVDYKSCPPPPPYAAKDEVGAARHCNAKAFNTDEVQLALDSAIYRALEDARKKGFVATRVDVVAHSQGGLVARWFVANKPKYRNDGNYGQGSIHRLITVGTPHLGTALAEWILQEVDGPAKPDGRTRADREPEYKSFSSFWFGPTTRLGAVLSSIDLDVRQGQADSGAEALRPSSVSLLSIVSDMKYRSIRARAPLESRIESFLTALTTSFDQKAATSGDTIDSILAPTPLGSHDTIVDFDSQGDGAIEIFDIPGITHAGIGEHYGFDIDSAYTETNFIVVFRQVTCWLTEGTVCERTPGFLTSAAATTPDSPPLHEVDFTAMTELPLGTSMLSPAADATIALFQPVTFGVTSGGRTITRVAYFLGAGIEDRKAAPFDWAFTPQAPGLEDLTAIVLFSDNSFTVAKATYDFQSPAAPIAVIVEPLILTLPHVGTSGPLLPTALYPTGGRLDVRELAAYAVEAGSSNVVAVSPEGMVTAAGVGSAMVTVSYAGKTAKVPVRVSRPAPSLSISDASVSEGDTGQVEATLTVSLSDIADAEVTVDYAVTGGTATDGYDFTANSGTLTFPVGTLTRSVTLAIIGDVLPESDETFFVNLFSASGAPIADGQAIGTIIDDDAALALSIDDVSQAEGSSGTSSMTFTATLSAVSGQTVTVNYATAAGTADGTSDFVSTSGTLTFVPGSTAQSLVVTVNGDLLDESDETFFLNLSNASGATIADTQGVGTIIDDDAAPTLSIDDVSQAEGSSGTSSMTFTATLSAVSGQTVTVSYATAAGTADGTSDFVSTSGTLTFVPGSTAQSLVVTINGDLLDEPDETFTVTLNGAVNAAVADGQAIGTILDDEALAYFTVTPCRLADTRSLAGPSGGPAVAANTTRNFPATGLCGIPATAKAVAVNVTVTGPTAGGNLRLYPADHPLPLASAINFGAGQTRANNAIVRVGTAGAIAVRCAMAANPGAQTHVILDAFGYFE